MTSATHSVHFESEASTSAVDSVQAEIRQRVVNLAQWMLPTIILPVVITAYLINRANGGAESLWLLLELVSGTLTIATLHFDRVQPRRNRWFIIGLGVLVLGGLGRGGPGMATSMGMAAWLFAAVFFLGDYRGPTLACISAIGATCLGGYLQLGVLPWAASHRSTSAWVLTFVATSATASAIAYLLHSTLSRLERAVSDGAVARRNALIAQRERADALAAAAEAQRLESLGRLAGGVAHDFNNAVGIISLCVDQLEQASDADRVMLIEEMRRASRGATATTRQLLSFARQGSTPGVRAPCGRVLLDLSAAIRRLFPESISVEVDAPSSYGVPLSVGDLEQLLLNLCLNARDAMSDGGTLWLSAVDTTATDGSAEVHIRVRDSGQGMSDDVRVRATDPFFTTKPLGKGTGLGLAMVSATVKSAGGRLTMTSTLGEGTTVDVVLPGVALVPHDSADAQSEPAALAVRKRVLVLEDDPQLQRLLKRSLSLLNLDVTMTGTVHDSLVALDDADVPDLLFTDAVLPDGGPTALVERYRERYPNGPVIVCSGYVPTPDLIAGIEAASYAFLAKPFGQQALALAIHRALAPMPSPSSMA